MVDNEESDGSVHSHIFPMLKVPPPTPPTLIRKRKVQAKKTHSKVASSIANPKVPDDLEEVFTPHDSERTSSISLPHLASQVFVFLYFPPTCGLIFDVSSNHLYPRNTWPI